MKTIDFYNDAKWGTNTSRDHLVEREELVLKLIRANLKGGTHILDIGCGNGNFLSHLNRLIPGMELSGMDYSDYKIDEAKKALPFDFRQGNVEEGLPFSDASFDLVYLAELLEHLYNPDILIQEAWRILKPEGTLILSTPNLFAWYNRLVFPLGIQPIFYETSTTNARIGTGLLKALKSDTVPIGHVRIFHKSALNDLFKEHGFQVQSYRGVIFERFGGVVRLLDRIFTAIPSLSSGLIVVARKVV